MKISTDTSLIMLNVSALALLGLIQVELIRHQPSLPGGKIMKKLELKLSLIFLISAISFYIFSQEQRINQLNSSLNQMENPGVIR